MDAFWDTFRGRGVVLSLKQRKKGRFFYQKKEDTGLYLNKLIREIKRTGSAEAPRNARFPFKINIMLKISIIAGGKPAFLLVVNQQTIMLESSQLLLLYIDYYRATTSNTYSAGSFENAPRPPASP